MADRPHRRLNPLTGEWVLVSPQRLDRPWQGQREPRRDEALPSHDPDCYLCPGNARAGGAVNPDYATTFVFANDYPAMTDAADGTDGTDAADAADATEATDRDMARPEAAGSEGASPEDVDPEAASAEAGGADPLFARRPVRGTSRVICFSPDHNLTLPLLPAGGVAAVIDCWADEVEALGKRFGWVQVFENKGAEMGCSNPHPHGQIWAQDELPTEAAKEDWHLAEYRRRSGGNLLVDYALRELEAGERIVEAGDDWVVLVPYWATWPFETLLLPLAPVEHLHALGGRQKATLARMLRRLLSRYDNLFECSFPYSMGWHGSPFGRDAAAHWQLHAHVYPPLLRSADVRKFMVGYEMLAEPQRDLKPETAAQMLREQSPVHYRSA